jgi:hypothetical protein
MNAKMERMSNSENFRARITETELRIENMALEDLEGKMVFLEGSRGICGTLSC